jgi:hypothetical protein
MVPFPSQLKHPSLMTLLGVMIVAFVIAADLDIASIAYRHDYDLISDDVAAPRALPPQGTPFFNGLGVPEVAS